MTRHPCSKQGFLLKFYSEVNADMYYHYICDCSMSLSNCLLCLAVVLGDVQSCPVAPWSGGASLESETESIAPKLESSADEGVSAEELTCSERPSWAAGSHEVMALGLSGEYLYTVKTEPHSHLIPVPTIDESRDSTGNRPTGFPGRCLVNTTIELLSIQHFGFVFIF